LSFWTQVCLFFFLSDFPNKDVKNLSAEAQREVAEMRDRVQDMLFQVVKELHPSQNAASRFGNLLLLLPTITV